MQLDQGEKGFSFMREGPLDMRMDPEQPLTAKEIVNSWSEEKLASIFQDLGEDPRAKQMAKAITRAREKKSIETTKELAGIIAEESSRKIRGKLHPATLVFQALRLAVNSELDALQGALPKALKWLETGGRLAIMSFHSLEDRIVKTLFKEITRIPSQNKYREERKEPELRLVTKKPLQPGREEIKKNPRSRSAKMRIIEKRGQA